MSKKSISRALVALFTAVSFASLGGCGSGDSEPGLDGEGDAGANECATGEVRCDGLVPQTCSADGLWESGEACASNCSAGRCVGPCVPGSKQCDGLVPQTCNDDGAWVDAAACDYVCAEGACTGRCVPGSKQCDGLVPQTCDADGAWVDAAACDYVCAEGACTGGCVPGSKQCDGLVPQTCNDDGAWVDAAACDYVCAEGACTGGCVPGSKQCDDLVPQTCDTGGAWVDAAACDYVCSEGACAGVCVPGDQRCADATSLETCDATGTWQTSACLQVCSATTQQCACEPGYLGDGTTCTPIDFCSAPNGGCSPNASCSQVEATPSCECEPGYSGDGYSCSAPASKVIDEGFDNITTLAGNGWLLANKSTPQGENSWFQGNDQQVFSAFDGAPNAYIASNYSNTTGSQGTISTWLATPVLDFGALAKASFYTRAPTLPGGGTPYADRIEVRLCTSDPCNLPSDSGVGSYTTVLTSVNPTLAPNGYPRTWTQITVTNADGLPTSGTGRIAIRYFVTGAGPTGANSDYIGIDRFVFEVGTPAYAVGGELTGLSTGAVVLWLNGGELLSLPANGAFEFAHKLDDGTPYGVSVYEQPEGQTCTVTDGTGSIEAADVASIVVSCTAD